MSIRRDHSRWAKMLRIVVRGFAQGSDIRIRVLGHEKKRGKLQDPKYCRFRYVLCVGNGKKLITLVWAQRLSTSTAGIAEAISLARAQCHR
jgi:hypothetical protein